MSRSVLLALVSVPVLLFCIGCPPVIDVAATASCSNTQSTDVDVNQSTDVTVCPFVPCDCDPEPDPKPDPQPDGDSVCCSNEGLVLESLASGEIRVTYPGGFGGGNAYLRITMDGNQLVEILSWDTAETEVVFDPAGQHGDVTVVAANDGPTVHCVY